MRFAKQLGQKTPAKTYAEIVLEEKDRLLALAKVGVVTPTDIERVFDKIPIFDYTGLMQLVGCSRSAIIKRRPKEDYLFSGMPAWTLKTAKELHEKMERRKGRSLL